jgi:hypothetical protein
MQQRLELAGIRSQREEGVECCYAKQTKFWVTDPDNNLWEIYTLEGDLEHRGPGQSREQMLPPTAENGAATTTATTTVWEHRLTEPVPETIPQADGRVDEVLLRGTFNLPLAEEVQRRIVREALRVLRPGGKLFVHVLTTERPLTQTPQLPGPAAAVQHVPQESVPPRLLEEAGFVGVEMIKFSAKPCFVVGGVAMRELQLIGFKPGTATDRTTQAVLYKGPYRQITDDLGNVYPRGERLNVEPATAELLRRGPLAEKFVFFA